MLLFFEKEFQFFFLVKVRFLAKKDDTERKKERRSRTSPLFFRCARAGRERERERKKKEEKKWTNSLSLFCREKGKKKLTAKS